MGWGEKAMEGAPASAEPWPLTSGVLAVLSVHGTSTRLNRDVKV